MRREFRKGVEAITPLDQIERAMKLDGGFLHNAPLFLTSTETVGRTAGHTDVSLWYILRGSRNHKYSCDQSEFRGVSWFHMNEVPLDRSDRHMERFLTKLYQTST